MEKKNVILAIVASLTIGIAVGYHIPKPTANVDSVSTQTYYDTIPIYTPTLRDSVVVRYETHRLPVDTTNHSVAEKFLIETTTDSVDVIVPITQKEYVDSTYRAWVSGYAAKLDSIEVYRRYDITTITKEVTKPKHWGVGITAGYGITNKGLQPYIGIGINYSLISF